MMLIPKEPRYNLVSKKALSFLIKYKISTFPVSPLKIINEFGCSIRTYSFHSKKVGCGVQDFCNACGSIDGYSVYNEITGEYKIAYNDLISSSDRIRFTLMHEIGHIYLRHFIDFKQTRLCRGGLDDNDLEILDKEANHFASKVIAPEMVLLHAGWNHPKIIHAKCALSTEASKYKAEKIIEMEKRRNFITNLEVQVLRQFHAFIYQKNCKKCHHYFIIPESKHCPICGSKDISWEKGDKNMIYKKINIAICPSCENEELNSGEPYCKICGTYLINICAGRPGEYDQAGILHYITPPCNIQLPSNARFCSKCGAFTTFSNWKLFHDWSAELYKKKEEQKFLEEEIPF